MTWTSCVYVFFPCFWNWWEPSFSASCPCYKLVYVTWRFPRNKDFWWSFSFSDMFTAGIATSWALANKWFLESFFFFFGGKNRKSDPSHITVIVLRWMWQVNWGGPGVRLTLIEWFQVESPCHVCMYMLGCRQLGLGSKGHEPPPPEQEASPQGQLLALKGPTHPWLNAPGLLCPRGCWFYRPIHSIAHQMREAKDVTTCLMLKEQQRTCIQNNARINTQALHARHVHLINLSLFSVVLVQEGLLFLRDPH